MPPKPLPIAFLATLLFLNGAIAAQDNPTTTTAPASKPTTTSRPRTALAAATANAQQIPDSLLTAIASIAPPYSNQAAGKRLLQQLDAAGLSDDHRFLYYKAISLNATKDKPGALKAAQTAVASKYLPTHPEVKRAARSYRLDLFPPSTTDPANLPQPAEKYFDDQMADFPYGVAEAEKLIWFHLMDKSLVLFTPNPWEHSSHLAAIAYLDMNMFPSALRMFNREDGGTSFESATTIDSYEDVAKCYQTLGQWENAQGYMIKSTVGRGFTKEKASFIREMDANIASKKQVEVPKPRPDAAKLEQIVVWCADANLFADAFEAIDELRQLGASPSVDTQIKLHTAIVTLIVKMKKYDLTGVQYRGIEVNDVALPLERQRLDELKKKLADSPTPSTKPATATAPDAPSTAPATLPSEPVQLLVPLTHAKAAAILDQVRAFRDPAAQDSDHLYVHLVPKSNALLLEGSPHWLNLARALIDRLDDEARNSAAIADLFDTGYGIWLVGDPVPGWTSLHLPPDTPPDKALDALRAALRRNPRPPADVHVIGAQGDAARQTLEEAFGYRLDELAPNKIYAIVQAGTPLPPSSAPPPPPATKPADEPTLRVRFDNVPLDDILTAMANEFHLVCIAPDYVPTRFTIVVQNPCPAAQTISLLKDAAFANGLALIQTTLNGRTILRVDSRHTIAKTLIPCAYGADPNIRPSHDFITQVIPVENLPVTAFYKALSPILNDMTYVGDVRPNGPDEAHKCIILTESAARLQPLVEIIAKLDRPYSPRLAQSVQLQHARAADVADALRQRFHAASATQPLESDRDHLISIPTRIDADPKTNSIFIDAPETRLPSILDAIRQLDTAPQ
jgi:type II secretory pathway component GspD/PulD (secretin)